MTATGAIIWRQGQSLEDLERRLREHTRAIEGAVAAVAERVAAILEDAAREGAPWQDQTGNARTALFGAAEVAGDIVTIYLSHGPSIDYGVYLETRNAERYAVIWPTIRTHMDEVFDLIAQELR